MKFPFSAKPPGTPAPDRLQHLPVWCCCVLGVGVGERIVLLEKCSSSRFGDSKNKSSKSFPSSSIQHRWQVHTEATQYFFCYLKKDIDNLLESQTIIFRILVIITARVNYVTVFCGIWPFLQLSGMDFSHQIMTLLTQVSTDGH